MSQILVGAHAGARCYAPENTLAAIEIAIRQGAYRVELDVRHTRDGHIVLMHDETVDRTTDGSGRVADLTLEEVQRLHAGGTEPVPTLEEVLRIARGRCKLLIEIKEERIADEVVRLIERSRMAEECAISSFHEGELLRVRELAPEIETAWFHLRPGSLDLEAVVARVGVRLLIVWPGGAEPALIAEAKRLGLHIRCGLPDDLDYAATWDLFRRMANVGIDELASGRPDWLAPMAEEYAQSAADRT